MAPVPPAQHRRRDVIGLARVLLPLLTVGGALLYAAAGLMDRNEARYSPAPLAQTHAMWENQCAVCHASSAPLDGDNWLAQMTGERRAADAACRTCHPGPPHHFSEKHSETPSCAGCHREHRGRGHALTLVADAQCLSCHRDIAQHTEGKGRYHDVTGFSAEAHPEFRLLRDEKKDPGTIEFNHSLHMSFGLRPDGEGAFFTIADIPPGFRARYDRAGTQGTEAPVQLRCASCHRLDHDDAAAPVKGLPDAARPTRPAGAAMLPIVFEQHCQACHPLTFAPAPTRQPKAAPLAVAHRLQPAEIRTWLRGYFTGTLLDGELPEGKPKTTEKQPLGDAAPKIPRPLAGGDRQGADQRSNLAEGHDTRIHDAERALYGPNRCQKCHAKLDPGLGVEQRVARAQIPQLWFQHARFDHTAHRHVDCRECHVEAYSSTTRHDVMLPGIRTCLNCHGPPRRDSDPGGGTVTGGARHDCALCHRYHAGDHPLHGRGTALRAPTR